MLSLLGNSLKTIHINTYFDIVCLFNVLIMCLDIINYNKPVPFPHKKHLRILWLLETIWNQAGLLASLLSLCCLLSTQVMEKGKGTSSRFHPKLEDSMLIIITIVFWYCIPHNLASVKVSNWWWNFISYFIETVTYYVVKWAMAHV